jgi:hypothetical protein
MIMSNTLYFEFPINKYFENIIWLHPIINFGFEKKMPQGFIENLKDLNIPKYI